MTAGETIELAQVSVDHVQRGLDFAQDRLDQSDVLIEMADRVTEVAENVTVQARRMPRRLLICGAIAVLGIIAIVIIKKRKQANASQESEEIVT
jgi:hypothetical protein